MRIAQVTYSTKPRGGVVHTLALAESLARAGHDVTVWTLGRGGDDVFFRPVDPAVHIEVVPFAAREDETVGERIQRSIRTMAAAFADAPGYDVVHAQDCISANAVGPCIRTIHHLDEFTTPELIRCHAAAIHDPVARICVSRAVADDVAAQYGPRPTVIPGGVDARRFAAAAAPAAVDAVAARARDAWQERLGRYVLALGGIEPRKGSIDLLEAFAMLGSDVALVFGGGETLFDYRPYRAAFEQRATELGITPVVLGVLDEPSLAPLVAGAAALGFVSTKEGFGLAAMEALAAGVPVVARDLPVLREVFGDTVAYADDVPGIAAALRAVLTARPTPQLTQQSTPLPAQQSTHRSALPDPDAGRALAASHDWDDVAARHVAFYEQVLARGGDGGAPIDLPDHHRAR